MTVSIRSRAEFAEAVREAMDKAEAVAKADPTKEMYGPEIHAAVRNDLNTAPSIASFIADHLVTHPDYYGLTTLLRFAGFNPSSDPNGYRDYTSEQRAKLYAHDLSFFTGIDRHNRYKSLGRLLVHVRAKLRNEDGSIRDLKAYQTVDNHITDMVIGYIS